MTFLNTFISENLITCIVMTCIQDNTIKTKLKASQKWEFGL